MTDFSLEHPGGTLALSVHEAEEGPAGIEITKLLKETGSVTYDPGFVNTASCRSDITYIDGDAGILRYRGYPIDQLAENASFLEVTYLLIYGELPTAAELEAFSDKVRRHTMLHEEMKGFFAGFPSDAHRWRSPPSACWPRCPRSRRTRTRSRSDSRSCTRTTRSDTSRTSCA
ncbi:hypothetical protein GCM10009557_62590 [Virgisporangium ochraceum]